MSAAGRGSGLTTAAETVPSASPVACDGGLAAAPPARMSSGQMGLAFVVVAALLWGTTGTATTFLPSGLPVGPQTFGFFRLAIGTPFLFFGGLLLFHGGLERLEGRHIPLTALFGTMIAVYQIAFFTSIEHAGVAVGTLLTLGTTPLFAAGFSTLLLREPLPAGVLIAGLAAVMGVACLVDWDAAGGSPGATYIGSIAGVAGGAAFGLVGILGRMLARRSAPPLAYTSVGFFIGTLVLLPLALEDGIRVLSNWSTWPVLLYLGAVPSAGAYLFFALGMQRVRNAAAGAATILLEPAAAVGLACILVGERLQLIDWAGAALLAAALLVVFRSEA